MKNVLPLSILLTAITALHSCTSGSINPNGTYIRVSDTELRVLTDTIRISPANAYNDKLYHVTRSSATYFKNAKDSQFNKRTRPNTITATIDNSRAQLQTEDPGIVYTLSQDGQSITINGIVYEKLK